MNTSANLSVEETVSVDEAEKITSKSLDHSKFVKLTLDIADHMLACGSEVSRIEESVSRICAAYGAVKCDVFCITSVVIVTVIAGFPRAPEISISLKC